MEWLLSALVSVVLTCVIGFFAMRKLKGIMYQAIGDVADNFIAGLEETITPTVKTGFSLAGKMGGDAKAVKNIQGKVAKAFIEKNYGSLKMVAQEVLGIDVDDMIDEYGAGNIIKALQGLGGILPTGGLSGLLSGGGPQNNPSRSEYKSRF